MVETMTAESMTTESATAESILSDAVRVVIGDAAARTVFGTPVRQDGVTVIPTAVFTAFGGGESAADTMEGRPASGVRVVARPAGAFVITDGRAAWRPAVDINRIILGGQIVAIVALLTVRAIVRACGGCKR